MVFELYSNHAPRSANNFKALCSGDNTKHLSYKGTTFHSVINGFRAAGGDVTNQEGKGGESIYGSIFSDENLKLKHYKRGMLTMNNCGPDRNNSQFLVTFDETPWLDGYHVIVGEMVEGEEVLKEIETLGSREGKPKAVIKVEDCGEVRH